MGRRDMTVASVKEENENRWRKYSYEKKEENGSFDEHSFTGRKWKM